MSPYTRAVCYGIFEHKRWCLPGIYSASPFDVFVAAALLQRAEAIVAIVPEAD
jgi:hypothetical protein